MRVYRILPEHDVRWKFRLNIIAMFAFEKHVLGRS
jgi:hypothetical protein